MLTAVQKKTLDFITVYSRERGVSPSVREITEHLGVKSGSGVMRITSALIERGFLRKIPYRSRAMEVVSKSLTADELARLSDVELDALHLRTSHEKLKRLIAKARARPTPQ